MRYVQAVHRLRPATQQLAAALAALVTLVSSCKPAAPTIEMYADGIDPQRVRFEVLDLGAPGHAALLELAGRGDVDGKLLLPEGACGGPCRAAMVSVFIENDAPAAPGAVRQPLAPPVIRLDVPAGKPARSAFSFRGAEISAGRIGRIRWIVELWPDERALTATVSSSVFLVDDPTKKAAPPPPTAPPTPTTTTPKEQP